MKFLDERRVAAGVLRPFSGETLRAARTLCRGCRQILADTRIKTRAAFKHAKRIP
jgi:hypothetical protein